MSVVSANLDKAARSFSAAEMLLANGYGDFAASRAHYGCFYVARALLFDQGITVSTHAAVIGEYGRLFAMSGRLNADFYRLLIRSFHAKQVADYDLDFDLSDGDVREMIAGGEGFLDAARDHLERKNAEDPAEQA